MTGHWRLSLLITVSCLAACMRRRHACANVTVRPAIVPDGNVDGNADDRPRRRTEHSSGAATWTFEPVDRHEPPDIYRHDPIAEPVAADDRDGYERHHSVEPAARPHQHHRQLSVSARLHRDACSASARQIARVSTPISLASTVRPWRSRHSVATSCCQRPDHSRAYRPCRAADVPSNCLPRGRLGRGVSEVLPVWPYRAARSSGAADSKREVPGLAARRERGRRERLRLGQCVGTTSALAAPRFRPRDSTCVPGR